MKDKTIYGFLFGIIAGLVMNIINLFSYFILHFADLRYLDFMSIIVWGNKPLNFWESTLAFFLHLGFTGFLGILFLFAYSVTLLYKVPQLTNISVNTIVSNLISAGVFGFVLGILAKNTKNLYGN